MRVTIWKLCKEDTACESRSYMNVTDTKLEREWDIGQWIERWKYS